MRKQLTAEMIGKLRPPATGRIELFDSIVPAMAVRITKNGAKTFVVRARVKGWSQPIRMTLGDATAMKLTDARQEASDLLKECRAGRDPREARRAKAAEAAHQRKSTFAVVAEDFIADHVSTLRDKDHAEAEIRRFLIKPWGKKPIASITDDDVAERIRAIKSENGSHVTRRVLAYAKMLFRWAAAPGRPGRLKHNPCAMLSAKRDFGLELTPRQVVLTADHVRYIWHAAASLSEPFGPFVRLLMLSGQRRGEVAGMKWTELDLDGERVWSIPAERMKAGRPHEVPLSAEMVAILRELRDARDKKESEREETRAKGDYVFSTTSGVRPISGFSKAKRALDEAVATLHMKAREDARASGKHVHNNELPTWRLHDIRRTVRTGLGAIPSIPHDIRELVVAHVPPALVTTYDLHDYREEKRQALTLWAERLARIVAPSTGGAAS
ncbi:MAG TPA: integrase arm-type DNA-binding domain-containing protein [Stellaceae bacterium]|nr:integrase arm-type DNA-binding domain-containing protein [Stellaceae bacterium]